MNTTDILRLMSDDTRIRVLMLLKVKSLCVSQMQLILNVPQSMLSKHLAKLREFELVKAIPDGKFMKYELIQDPLVLSMLDTIAQNADDNEFQADKLKIDNFDYILDACNDCELHQYRTRYIV